MFRSVRTCGRDDYEFVRPTGLLADLTSAGSVIGATEVPISSIGGLESEACYVLEHPRVPFISYPYEWSFHGLKAAALLTLDVHLAALERGVTLSDASAYNVQFIGPRPIFIDYLSFERYEEGEYWAGHRQFCEHFLNPLLLTAKTGIPFQDWYRGSLDGIPASWLAPLLPLRSRLSWNALMHVTLQARLSTPAMAPEAAAASRSRIALSQPAFKRMLQSLRKYVANLEPRRRGRSVWRDYSADVSYTTDAHEGKLSFVSTFFERCHPEVLWDLGCNRGEYASLALRKGVQTVIGFEGDHSALDAAFTDAVNGDLEFLPLYTDLANPSPDLGWRQRERAGLMERAKADALLALALLHHLAIGRNIPLESLVAWLIELAPQGVIEFVPKSDPMVHQLLTLRDDVFDNYTEGGFLQAVRERAEIVQQRRLEDSERLLVWYER